MSSITKYKKGFNEKSLTIEPFEFTVKTMNTSDIEILLKNFEHSIHWEKLSCFHYLSLDIIREYKDKLVWFRICESNQLITPEFLLEHKEYLCKFSWECLIRFNLLDFKEFIMEHAPKNLYQYVFEQYEMTVEEFEKHKEYVNMQWACKQQMPLEIIEKYPDELDWAKVAKYQSLSNEIWLKYKKYMPFTVLYGNSRTPEFYDILEELGDIVNWKWVSRVRKLNEEQLRRYSKYISWNDVVRYYELSNQFMLDYIEHLDFDLVRRHQHYSMEVFLAARALELERESK